MARILGIGNATIDIVHTLPAYPAENDEVRCDSRTVCRGGNTANTLVVLGQSGHSCSWAGVLTDDADGHFVRDDLAAAGVETAGCQIVSRGAMPVSTVILGAARGSRTIVHYRDLPEYRAETFSDICLQDFDWLHFEGRNIAELGHMLERVRGRHPAMPVSLEVEKPREGVEALFGQADVLLFSAEYAGHHGYDEPAALLQEVHRRAPAADMFCTRGASGAVSMDRSGTLYRQPALAPGPVVNTLGAGDAFNAGVIAGYLGGLDMAGILRQACDVAGRKCMQGGFSGLKVTD
jgi:ketohexokinase